MSLNTHMCGPFTLLLLLPAFDFCVFSLFEMWKKILIYETARVQKVSFRLN